MSNNDYKSPEQWMALRILYNPSTDEVQVNGPLNNGILFLGMLEMAKVIFYQERAKAQKEVPRIVVPTVQLKN